MGRVCFSAKEKDEAKFALGARQRVFRSPLGSGTPVALVFEIKIVIVHAVVMGVEVKGKMVDRVYRVFVLGLVAFANLSLVLAANHAVRVVSDELVVGPGNSWTEAGSLLGEPARQTNDPDPVWGGIWPVDPFGGPYLPGQIVQMEAGRV